MVFIGQDLDKEAISRTLDEALLNDEEWGVWEKVRFQLVQ